MTKLFYWIAIVLLLAGCTDEVVRTNPSGAGLAMDAWGYERAYPSGTIDVKAYEQAYYSSRKPYTLQKSNMDSWQSLGPFKTGGRTLCLAFHPTDPDIMYVGTSGGGLWRTTTRGRGPWAWEHVPTGHPVLGVGAMYIDPADPDVLLMGTGECYNSIGWAEPGTIDRLVRGMYGIGILRSEDGGTTWSRVLTFDAEQATGVSDFAVSKQDPNIIYAATSLGVYRSIDKGISWEKVIVDVVAENNICIDIEIHPDDDKKIIASMGGLNLENNPLMNGIYISTDGGGTWSKTTSGAPRIWSGNAKLTLDPQNGDVVWASIQESYNTDAQTSLGLYRSEDFGATWEQINDTNVALWQGWYSHDIAVHPLDSNELIYVGIDTWKSTSGGSIFLKKSRWDLWTLGGTDDDAPPAYVHADIHAVYYHPQDPNQIFLATDGGVFMSKDGGTSFEARNGGLQIAQFYPNVSTSTTDPDYMLGGTQDNGIWKYDGTEWIRVLGGDGTYTAIDPTDDRRSYAASQFLYLVRSDDRFGCFQEIPVPRQNRGEATAFIAPFELAPTAPDRIYAGRQYVYNSSSGGFGWSAVTAQPLDAAGLINSIAISHQKHRTLYASTAPNPLRGFGSPKLWKSENGGVSWDQMEGLPDRVVKDIAFDPTDDQIAYVVFSGYHTEHMAKTTDGGESWQLIEGLPNVPTNTVLVDPANPNHVYIGNDIGAYFSADAGATWEPMNDGLSDAVMVLHLHLSPANRKLRMATHGRGIYQIDMVHEVATSTDDISEEDFDIKIVPNPVQNTLRISWSDELDTKKIEIYSIEGRSITGLEIDRSGNGASVDLSTLSAGQYVVRVQGAGGVASRAFVKM